MSENFDNQNNKGCIRSLLGWGIRQGVLVLLGGIMIAMTLLNLYFSNFSEETCGLSHPLLFEVSVNMLFLDDTEEQYSFGNSSLPIADAPTDIQDDRLMALFWESCLQYYGISQSNGDFKMNSYGRDTFYQTSYFVDGETVYFVVTPNDDTSVSKLGVLILDEIMIDEPLDSFTDDDRFPVEVSSGVVLSVTGVITLYLVLPSLVILVPLFTILTLRGTGIHWWVIMIVLIAGQTLTTSLLYIQLADVSGIGTLEEFGIGIFTGVVTGTALAFMSKVLDRFGE